MKKINIREEETSQYYIQLYFEALKRIDRINDIKVSFLKLSVSATFVYFSWLIVYQTNIEELSRIWKITLWLVPLTFNVYGLIYNTYLKLIAKRYGDFTRYLVSRTANLQHLYDDYLKEKKPLRPHLSQVFWIAICLISGLFGFIGIITQS